MKPLAEWTEQDLQKLIDDDVRESIELDYKRSDSLAKTSDKRNELAKDVSAFANSAGGRLIYGIIEKGNSPKEIDGGCDPQVISREWIEQTINSIIQPRVSGIFIKPIDLANGNCAYVLDVPRAMAFAPHQATDKKYYRRHNFMSVPMEDYEVKDAMRRATVGQPVVKLKWRIVERDHGNDIVIDASITNESSEPVLYATLQMLFDERFIPVGTDVEGFDLTRNVTAKSSVHGAVEKLVLLSRNWMPPTHMPIFKEKDWHLFTLTLPRGILGDFYVACQIACPGFSSEIEGIAKYFGNVLEPGAELADLFQVVE